MCAESGQSCLRQGGFCCLPLHTAAIWFMSFQDSPVSVRVLGLQICATLFIVLCVLVTELRSPCLHPCVGSPLPCEALPHIPIMFYHVEAPTCQCPLFHILSMAASLYPLDNPPGAFASRSQHTEGVRLVLLANALQHCNSTECRDGAVCLNREGQVHMLRAV